MNPIPFLSRLFNNLAIVWLFKNAEDQSEIYKRIDIQVKNTEDELDTFKLEMMRYKTKSEALEKENNKLKEENDELKKRLDTFENPN